jgi:hypothetical protein
MKNISVESSDLKAKVGQTILGSFDEHGLGEYLIVAKRPVDHGGHRFYAKWALDDTDFRSKWEARQQAKEAEKVRMAEAAAIYRRGRVLRPDLAAREDHLRNRADEFHGKKRHGFVNRANRVGGEIVDAARQQA